MTPYSKFWSDRESTQSPAEFLLSLSPHTPSRNTLRPSELELARTTRRFQLPAPTPCLLENTLPPECRWCPCRTRNALRLMGRSARCAVEPCSAVQSEPQRRWPQHLSSMEQISKRADRAPPQDFRLAPARWNATPIGRLSPALTRRDRSEAPQPTHSGR